MNDEFIAHYRITAKLGQGGMGEVYRGTDTKLDREVAIKILPPEIADDLHRRGRFVREAKAASALNHPNVCTIYEVGQTEDGRPFIAMELLRGKTLDSVTRAQPVENETVVEIGIQIADALEAAHQAGIIHRDVKPSNIHLDEQGHVKILDFGLAKRTEGAPSTATEATTEEQTEPGKVMGTPSYMSPEQAKGQPLDHRSDLFSLGIVLYQLSTGRLPFQGSSFADTVEKITHAQPEAIARFNYNVSNELERIIRKCLEKKTEDRFQTAQELLIDLRRLNRESTTLIRAQAQSPSFKTLRVGVPAVLLAVTVVLMFLRPWEKHDSAGTFRYGKSVAVIPFELKSAGMEFFADGLGEELANALGGLRKFDKVPPWSSSSDAGAGSRDRKSTAELLEVSTILEGSIRKAGDQVRISMTLIDPFRGNSGAVIWSDNYDYNQDSELPFAIQDEITGSVVEALQVQLDNQSQFEFVNRYTTSPEAYECYQKGRFHWKQRGVGLEAAKQWFELALLYDSPTGRAENSDMALAFVGLADTYTLQAFYGFISAREGRIKANYYVQRALEIDNQMAEAYATLGWIKMVECDGTAAGEAFRRSIELNDRLVNARIWYAAYFGALGEYEKGREQARKAMEIDSISKSTRTMAAWQISTCRGYEEAIGILKKVVDQNPDYIIAQHVLGVALLDYNQPDAAVERLESAVGLSGEVSFNMVELALAYASTNQEDKARGILARLEPKFNYNMGSIGSFASAYLAVGDREKCYQILEKFVEETGGFPWILRKGLEPLFYEPRFIQIVNRSGLLKYNSTTRQYELNSHPRK